MPGRASSARMNSAITPPTMKKKNAVTMYILPSVFGSVVLRYPSSATPGRSLLTGYARLTTGRGATAVTAVLQQFVVLASR